MPHDANGRLLKIGDTVIIECIVESVQAQEEYCNINLRTKIPMPPYEVGNNLTLNTKQVALWGRNEVDARDIEISEAKD